MSVGVSDEEAKKVATWWRANATHLRDMEEAELRRVEVLAQWASEELARIDQEAADRVLPKTGKSSS